MSLGPNSKTAPRWAAVVLILLFLSAAEWVIEGQSGVESRVRIDHFGKVSGNYYRGGQPHDDDYATLAQLGVKAIVDLRDGGPDNEQMRVEQLGMKFYRIPLSTKKAPSDGAIQRFLEIVNDPANKPVFVHCEDGEERTGVMTAVYRITHDDWNADKAFAEMQAYHFHGDDVLKHFIYSYAATKR
jgi:protein tyrosine/serine phosphatase